MRKKVLLVKIRTYLFRLELYNKAENVKGKGESHVSNNIFYLKHIYC